MSTSQLPRATSTSSFSFFRRQRAHDDTLPADKVNQYPLLQVLAIWAAAAFPMGILGWIVAPALAPDIRSDPVGAVVIRYGVLTLGLIWMFVLSLIVVYREEGNVRWATVRRRLRLNTPR